jgi:S-formylglutathione hydrolase FrmB
VLLLAGVVAGAFAWARRPDTHGARIAHLTIASRFAHRRLPVTVVVPAGGGRRPLLVFLHGRGGDQDSEIENTMFAALARLGHRAPVIAFPDGTDHSYWHDRRGGAWGSYIAGEVIPQVARRFATDPRRVAIGGISMGGFGAFDLARLHPWRFCAVGGHSPALWRTSGETAAGAFDDAQDFGRHDVVGAARSAPGPFLHVPVWLDAGDRDPFRPGDAAFFRALRAAGARVSFHIWPGGHEHAYWERHWGAYLGFYAGALARCRH